MQAHFGLQLVRPLVARHRCDAEFACVVVGPLNDRRGAALIPLQPLHLVRAEAELGAFVHGCVVGCGEPRDVEKILELAHAPGPDLRVLADRRHAPHPHFGLVHRQWSKGADQQRGGVGNLQVGEDRQVAPLEHPVCTQLAEPGAHLVDGLVNGLVFVSSTWIP